MHDVTARIEIPTRTILKVLLVLGALWFFARIGPVLAQLFAGILLAMALYPPVARLRRRGLAKGRAIAAVFGTLIAGLALALWFLIPAWIDEGQAFVEELPAYVDEGTEWIEGNAPWLAERLEEWAERWSRGEDIFGEPQPEEDGPVGTETALNVGQRIGGLIATAAIAIVLAIYFLADGDRAFAWLSRDLSPGMTGRIRRVAPALSEIVHEYVVHQVQTSVVAGVFTYVVLAVLGVPSALILATIVAIADAVPLIGVVLAALPAVVVALTQGWEAALAVLVLFFAYQVFENYVLIPRLLGHSLRLSSFGMLMAVLIGWKLAGLVGVLLALPTAAALLVVERVWTDEDAGLDVPETAAPGPAAVAGAAVDVAADLAGNDAPEGSEEAGEESAPHEAEHPVGPPAPGAGSAGGETGRRGGRRSRAGQTSPGTTPG